MNFSIKNPLARKNTHAQAAASVVLTERAQQVFARTGGARVVSASRPPTFAYTEEGSFAIAREALTRTNVRHTATWDEDLGGYTIILPR